MKFFLLLVFLLLALFSKCEFNKTQIRVINGRWKTRSSKECVDNLVIDQRYLRFLPNETDVSKVNISYYKYDGVGLNKTGLVYGNCEAIESLSENSYIKTNFTCDSSSELFKSVDSSYKMIVVWDIVNFMMTIDITQKATKKVNGTDFIENVNCRLTGENDTSYVAFRNYNITQCSCWPCCFSVNSSLTFTSQPILYNMAAFKINFDKYEGPYCDETFTRNELLCTPNYTTWGFNYIYDYQRRVTFFVCDHLEARLNASISYIYDYSAITMVWNNGNCYAEAVQVWAPKNSAGYNPKKLRILWLLLVFIFLINIL